MTRSLTSRDGGLDLDALAAAVEAEAMSRNGKRSNGEIVFSCPSPGHDDKRPSANYNVAKRVWICRSCDAKGGLAVGDEPLAPLLGLDLDHYSNKPRTLAGASPKAGNTPDDVWEIPDFDRKRSFHHVCRKLPDGQKKVWWQNGLDGRTTASLPLYAWERLSPREAGDDSPIIVCEGERATDAVLSIGVQAVGTVTGANSTPGPEALALLENRRVVLWPDNDSVGWDHMQRVAAGLVDVATDVAVWQPPGLPDKGDSVEWLAEFRAPCQWLNDGAVDKSDEAAKAELLDRIEREAQPFSAVALRPSPEERIEAWLAIGDAERPSVKEIIPSLQELDPLDYERYRKAVAAAARGVDGEPIRVSALDKQVEVALPNEGGRGQPEEQEIWPDEVDGEELLNDLAKTFTRFLALPKGSATTLSLWTVFAHAHDAFAISPLLAIVSPEKRCGKTRLLSVLGGLVPNAIPAANMSTAAVFRVVDSMKPTLLIDEADTFLNANAELTGVLNAGHVKGMPVYRCVGDDSIPKAFEPWCPKAIAMIGKPRDTLEDRSILVSMRRRAPGEAVEPFRLDRTHSLSSTCRRAARWAKDNFAELRTSDPELPDELHDRAKDNWRQLAAIADVAGGDWPAKAREAAKLISTGGDDESSAKAMLLEDIKEILDERKADVLATAELLAELLLMEHRPWPEWRRGQPITARGIANQLADFGIKPKQLWINGSKARGYERDDFLDAWERYLPPTGSSGRTEAGAGSAPDDIPVEKGEPTASENDVNPYKQSGLPGLPDTYHSTGRGE